uniref:Uncharacterized protein n=1 Tax=Micrurus corallinus TaxID=54390 RepID=A0A2D4FQ23_MICCO
MTPSSPSLDNSALHPAQELFFFFFPWRGLRLSMKRNFEHQRHFGLQKVLWWLRRSVCAWESSLLYTENFPLQFLCCLNQILFAVCHMFVRHAFPLYCFEQFWRIISICKHCIIDDNEIKHTL